jgi:hypothetical protein
VTTDETGYRIERDTMGEVRVPANALWRAQTQRAVENFPISGRGLEPAHIRALAQIKGAAAQVNATLGVLDEDLAKAIATAAAHVADSGMTTSFRSTCSRPVRHVVEHERQRGDRDAGVTRAGPAGASQRPRQRVAVQQ